MDTTRTGAFNLEVPSGCEVEAATFHAPAGDLLPYTPPEHSGIRGKLDDLKSRSLSTIDGLTTSGLAKVHDLQQTLADRGALIRRNVQHSISTTRSSVRDGVNGRLMQLRSAMRSSPMKWAGIAAGSGLAIGLAGRLVQRRSRERYIPQLVIIETSF
jgi:hypothetical protein